MKNTLAVVAIIAVLLGGSIWWSKSMQKSDPTIITRNGLHWHPLLEIYVKGEKQIIPPNIGIGTEYAATPTYDPSMRMTAIHTHDDADEDIIHLEFSGTVREEDTRLSKFFDIWNKDINSFGLNVKMTVNGEGNSELGNYLMRDGDKIVLSYE